MAANRRLIIMSLLYSDGWDFVALIRFPWGHKCVLQHHMGWALCFWCAYCHLSNWICTISLFGCSYHLHSPGMESTSERPESLQWYPLQWLFLILFVSQRKRITLGSMLRFPFLFYFFLFYHITAMWANGFWWKWDIVRTILRKFPLPPSFEITSKLKEFPVEGLEKWFNGELRLPVQRTLIQFPEPYSGSQLSLTQVLRDLPSSCVFLQVPLHTGYVCIDSGKILIHKHKNK